MSRQGKQHDLKKAKRRVGAKGTHDKVDGVGCGECSIVDDAKVQHKLRAAVQVVAALISGLAMCVTCSIVAKGKKFDQHEKDKELLRSG